MITTVDVETSYQKTEAGGFDPSPFNPDNILVSVGINDEYYFTNHSERIDEGCHAKIQKILDETKILIGHKIKFDLSWLLEAGFTYTGNVYDTMIAEYVLNRGVRKSLTLLMCCQRRKLDAKDDAVKEYMDRGVSFENIPAEIVEQYGRVDVAITRQLFDSQMVDLRSDKDKGLLKTIKDKNEWAKIFNTGVDKFTKKNKKRPKFSFAQFRTLVANNSEPIYRTMASQCLQCAGKGVIKKIKVDGSPYKKYSKCDECHGEGFVYAKMAKLAGFDQRPRSVYDVSDSGFKTDRITLNKIAGEAEGEFKDFIDSILRHNAISTYLNTFVEGLQNFTNANGLLHPKFMQAVTATGRLSSRDPNFQNQPRGNTFPIRKVIQSRFEDGQILEVDFAQLEFRTAVFLAQDKQGMEDIKNNIDVHKFTADIIGVSRQDAKAHTFKPLYGGTTGTDAEKKYYKTFAEKYKGISKWHEELQSQAITFKRIKLPTGREYSFPYAERMPWGGSSYGTQIKNYPVQGLATADIVPLACIKIYKLMNEQRVKSLLINTVHDSIVADVYPGEEAVMSKIFDEGTASVIPALKEYYGINFNVPLDTEIKMGYDWLNMKEVNHDTN